MTWTEKTRDAEVWTIITQVAPYVGFDDTGFDSGYDYGHAAGLWVEKTQQSETWAVV